MPFCQTVRLISSTYVCVTCISNYTFEGQICVKQVFHCAVYEGGMCIKCVNGYFIIGSTCVKQSD